MIIEEAQIMTCDSGTTTRRFHSSKYAKLDARARSSSPCAAGAEGSGQ